MNVRGIREVDFVFTSDKEILFVVPNSIKIRRRDGKLRLRKFFVRHCLTTKNLFQMVFCEQSNALGNMCDGSGGIDKSDRL